MRQRLLVALILLSLPAATAQLADLSFSFNDAPNNRVQPSVPKMTNIEFTVEPQGELTTLDASLNAANLTDTPRSQYQSIPVDLGDPSECSYNGSIYDCTARNQLIRSSEGYSLQIQQYNDTTVSLALTVQTESGEQTYTASEDIIVDDQPPVPTEVGPTKCLGQDRCYINEEPLNYTASFESGTGPFDQQKVVITAENNGEQHIRFGDENACQGSTCQTQSSIECSTGDTITYSLNDNPGTFPPTQDDAGNIIESNVQQTATCDKTSPIIESLSIGGGAQGIPTVEAGATITAKVDENTNAAPQIQATVQDSQTTSKCSEDGDQYTCTVNAPANIDSAGEQTVGVKITDQAGNEATRTQTVRFREATSNQSSIWSSAQATTLTNSVNKDILEANPKAYSRVRFTPERGNTELNDVDIKACNTTKSIIETVSIDHVNQDSNQAYVSLTLRSLGFNQTIEQNQARTTCSFEVTGTTSEFVYTQGETENATITLSLREGQRLTSNLQEEIESTRNSIQDYNDGIARFGKGIEVAQRVCRVGSILEGVFTGMSLTGEALSQAQLTKPAGEALKGIEDKSRKASSGLWRLTNNQFCRFLTCQTDWQKDQVKQLNDLNSKALDKLNVNPSDSTTLSSLQGITGQRFNQAYSPYRSSAAAVWSVCLPAIRKHVRSYKAIECNYLDCLDQAKEAGFSVERCRAQRSRAQCTFTGKQIWNNLPLTNMLSQQFSKVTQLLNDPVAAGVTLAGSLYCPSASSDSSLYFLCEVGSTAEKAQEYARDAKQIVEAQQYYSDLTKPPSGLCEEPLAATSNDEEYYDRATRNEISLEGKGTIEVPVGDDQEGGSQSESQQESSSQQTENTQQTGATSNDNEVDFGYGDTDSLNPAENRPADTSGQQDPGAEQDSPPDVNEDDSGGEDQADSTPETVTVATEYTPEGQVVGKAKVDGYNVIIKPDGTIVNADSNKPMADLQNEKFQALKDANLKEQYNRANDLRFANRLNSGSGPPVSLDEAAEIRKNLGEANMQSIREADAMRAVGAELGQDQSPKDITIPDENGKEVSGAEYLANNVEGLTRSEAKKLDGKAVNKKMKEELGPALGNLTEARYNATPIQMATWNAGALGRSILTSRSLGLTVWDDWSELGFGAMEDVASVSETFAAPQRKICGQVAPSLTGQASGDVGITVENNTANIGALVGGTRSDLTGPQGNTNYSYVIGYKAITGQEGLAFDIVLKGSDGTKTVTESLTGSSPIEVTQEGEGNYKVIQRQDLTVSEQYSRVCMQFTSNPDQYFRRTTFDGNELCQRLRR